MRGILALTFLGLCTSGVICLDICEDQINGARLAHPTDCSKYVVCQQQETAYFSACPTGLHFNRHIGECDLKSRAGCEAPKAKFSSAATSEGDCDSDCSCCCCCCNGKPPTEPPPSTPGVSTPGVSTPGSGSSYGPGTITPTPDPGTITPSPGPGTITPSPGPGTITPSPGPGTITPSPGPGTITPGPGPGTITPGPGPTTTPTPETPAPIPGCSNNLTVCSGQIDGSHHLYPNNCNQFIVCVNGCSVPMDCPANLQYSLKAGACVYPEDSECPWESTPPSGPNAGPSGISCENPGRCAAEANGALFADPSSTGYIVCMCQCEVPMPCSTGTVYNPEKKSCDWPQKGDTSDTSATFTVKCPEGLVYNASIGVCDWPLDY